jgi:hypothetical protein
MTLIERGLQCRLGFIGVADFMLGLVERSLRRVGPVALGVFSVGTVKIEVWG